jgi:hypothetical protein
MVVAGVPAPAGNGGPAGERDGESSVAHGPCVQLATRDRVLIPLDDLILDWQPARIHAELAVYVCITARLEAHVAFLSVIGQLARVTQRNQFGAARIHEAYECGNRPPRCGIDHAADYRLSGARALRRSQPGDTCAGRRSQEAAAGPIDFSHSVLILYATAN